MIELVNFYRLLKTVCLLAFLGSFQPRESARNVNGGDRRRTWHPEAGASSRLASIDEELSKKLSRHVGADVVGH